jgi:hypothetical protein
MRTHIPDEVLFKCAAQRQCKGRHRKQRRRRRRRRRQYDYARRTSERVGETLVAHINTQKHYRNIQDMVVLGVLNICV